MRKSISISIVVILVLTGLGAIAIPQEQNIENNKIKVAFSKLTLEDEGKYITINLEEANSLLIEEGKPLLPMYTHQIVLPFGTKVKTVKATPRNIVEKILPKQITPSPIAMTVGTETITNNVKTTEISDPYPENWYDYDIRVGLKNNEKSLIIDTYFYPISYHPKDGTISWAKEVDITIEFEPAQECPALKEGYDFIILTADEFYNALTPLIDHKTNRNVSTKIVKLSEIINSVYFPVTGSDDAEKVKYFIYQAADEEGWNTKNVMLVGNKDKFPTRETHVRVSDDDEEIFVSDLYFADFLMYNESNQEYEYCDWDSNDNTIYAEYGWETKTDYMDLEPDVSIGRLAANDEEEVTTIVNKIITYENTEAYAQNWFFNMVYCGGDSFIDKQNDSEGVLEGEYVNEEVMTIMDGFIPKKMWVSNNVLIKISPTGVSENNEAISEGCGFIDFSGHGNTDVWATHPHLNDNIWVPTPVGQYHSNNIEDLTNGDKLPIVVTGACSVSKFSKDTTCFSWSFISTNGGGSIANFGATGIGYAYIGTYVTYGLIEGIAIETFTQYDKGALT
ncbi:MAG: C25 family cysteine peptidase, partial [Candidatus Thermoplasmatota archaeon]|nr:C25 family cysteine peptidase [Candidatus Thermoplasmatota archaeon]